MPELSGNKFHGSSCENYVNLCSIFVSIIIGFVTLPKNMAVINAVPGGTDIKLIVLMLLIMLLKDVYCICLAVYSCTEFSSV